jgi:hypothetical protein
MCHSERAEGRESLGPYNDRGRWHQAEPLAFPFNGKINKLTFNLGPMQLSQADKGKAAKAIAIAGD